ncbi:LOW QUALITY PROTEIN: hypothetical protein HID58_043799, partial [Brassica napus]
WLSSPGEYNHTSVQLAGELSDVMVELLTRVTVQPSGEWLLCGIRSTRGGQDVLSLAVLYMVPKVEYHSYTEDTGVEISRTGRDQVELAGRADSRRRRSDRRRPEPSRWLSSPGECNRTSDQLAGKLTGVMLVGELSDVMVELAGELTRVTVQLSGEWLLCEIRSFVHFRTFFQ